MKYSGGGVLIQQLAIEDATGRALAELAPEWLFKPIGMTSSFYLQPLPLELEARAARGHFRDGKAEEVKSHIYPELAAAGLWTTPEDLCKLAIELQKSVRGDPDRVLNAESAREMVTLVGVGDFAVGFHDIERDGAHYFEHNGINWGFACSLVAARDGGVGMAIMTNKYSATAFMAEIEKRIAIAYGWPGYGETDN
jgi:CubicO group peptidase (beta-lactamase class C family)